MCFKQHAKALTLAAKTDWIDGRYYKFLNQASKQELLFSQVPFYYAVEAFPRLLINLAGMIECGKARLMIVENIWEEHGKGDPSRFHTETFKQHLQALGHDGIMHRNPFIEDWLKQLQELKTANELFHHLAAIEYFYAVISSSIADKLLTLPLEEDSTHYTKHSVLDWSHGEEILCSMVMCGIEFDETLFRTAQTQFLRLFDSMTLPTTAEIEDVLKSTPLSFFHARESTDVIDCALNQMANNLSVLTVCSGGENPIHYASKSQVANITAFDLNVSQIELCMAKLNGDSSITHFGRFEYLFDFVRAFFSGHSKAIVTEYQRAPELLNYVIDIAFNDAVLQKLFTPAATQYTTESFSEHFKSIYAELIKHHDSLKLALPNTQNILFGKPICVGRSLGASQKQKINFQCADIHDVIGGENYDVIDLSNIGDWMPFEEFMVVLEKAYTFVNKGGCIILRRLLGDYRLKALPFDNIRTLYDNTGFYTETVAVLK